MTNIRPVLLIVDDEPTVREMVARFAQREGFDAIPWADGARAIESLLGATPDLAMVDVRMPNMGGIEVLKQIRTTAPGCPVILMSGFATVETAVEAIRLGAMDYLRKPLDLERLRPLFAEVRETVRARVTGETDNGAFHGMIGQSPAMQGVSTAIRRLAPYARVALVTGETGTGKELAAHALHACGPRAAERLVTVNCSAVVETLFESELFGHVKGAFTGATADKAGLFEQAHRGTLFLDEIGELPLAVQAKLLRVLESGELLRVGALQSRRVDVHVIAATNRNLAAEVAAGRFRQDLLFRLNMIEIALPALRTRREDILPLARAFMLSVGTRIGKRLTGLTPAAERTLSAGDWPGNVRELRNTIERACFVAEGELIENADLQGAATGAPPCAVRTTRPRSALAAVEREHVAQAMAEHGGNKCHAAAALGISRRALYRRLEKHGLDGGQAIAADATTPGEPAQPGADIA